MKNIYVLGSALLASLIACGTANAANFTQDYIVDAKASDLTPTTGPFDHFNARWTVQDAPILQLTTGDTLSGTVTFANGTTLQSDDTFGMVAIFSAASTQPQPFQYVLRSSASIFDANGTILDTYDLTTYSNHTVFNTIYSGTSSGAKIAGMRYTVTFNRLEQIGAGGPVSVRLTDVGAVGIKGLIAAVPEPSAWAMMMLGMASVGLAMRRRRVPSSAALA